MCRLIEDIQDFLERQGFECTRQTRHGLETICICTSGTKEERLVLPLEIRAASPQEAEEESLIVKGFISQEGYPLIITEDRWKCSRGLMEMRLMAHLNRHSQVYARNCEIRRIDKMTASGFLNEAHSYGDAACRYRYGLFLKRHTGHIAAEAGSDARPVPTPGSLVAVAEFSGARKWKKGDKTIRSYEWTRYASLPYLRISGGMGKLLQAFISEVNPDDIMSYADLEWSEGEVYSRLGFSLEGQKSPVMFLIDRQWNRLPVKHGPPDEKGMTENLFFCNFGSNKYRIKLTDYE